MCGRYTLRSQLKDLTAEFHFEPPTKLVWGPRFNVAPTQNIAIVKDDQLSFARWGLIPSWADDPKVGSTLFNAKAEEVAEKPTFRSSFRRGRCLVLADGFYEWKQEGKVKQPYFIHMPTIAPSLCGPSRPLGARRPRDRLGDDPHDRSESDDGRDP